MPIYETQIVEYHSSGRDIKSHCWQPSNAIRQVGFNIIIFQHSSYHVLLQHIQHSSSSSTHKTVERGCDRGGKKE